MKHAYFARCQAIYNKPVELRDISLIRSLGYEVIPFPPQEDLDAMKTRGEVDIMDWVFRPLVHRADVLFFRALPGGKIPAGVAKEIGYAASKPIPILELPSLAFNRVLSVEETREYLKEVGQR